MNETVKWTDILQAFGSIASALISIIGFMLLWRQIKLTNETLKQNNQTSIYTISAEIYKYLADNSHLRPYLHENKELAEKDPNLQQLLVFCEVLADFFEFVLVKKSTLDRNFIEPWEYYMKKIYQNSPVFRSYIDESKDQYSETLKMILYSARKKIEN